MQAGGVTRSTSWRAASTVRCTLATNNIALRAHQHRTGAGSEFTPNMAFHGWSGTSSIRISTRRSAREAHQEMGASVEIELIESFNPEWTDLYDVLNR